MLTNSIFRREAKFIKKIVDENIWEWLPRTNELHVAKHPIGIKSRIQGIISDLSSDRSNDVLMVGIWGMGGLGKTTVAKAIYNQIHRKFEFKSFLAVSNATSKQGLVYLQEKLISDIMKHESRISSVDEGISLIKQHLQRKRVLVIIDNIDDQKQLDAIARSHDWFGSGSRIIMTTRNEHLLKQVEVDETYPLQEMKKEEALELFSWHAFKKSCPNEEYLQVSKEVVSYCRGLPLALEVLGSLLLKRPIKEWKSQLEKLERIPEEEIIKHLRISFEGLDDTGKATFLDISCFFIGKDKDYVAKILDGCGFYATLGISVLRERCLVTIEYNCLKMHDLIQEMARVIISEKFPDRPGKWSRLWNHQEVTDVLTNESGTGKIEGLALHFRRSVSNKVASFSTKAFAKMKKLRLLQLRNVELKGKYKHLPKELIWLHWEHCPLKSIPDDFFNQPRLVGLEMQYSNLVQVWEGSKSLHNLKTLDLSYSYYLQKSLDFSQVPNLEELILQECVSLTEIHPSIGHLKRLSLVKLKDCYNLSSLPRDFYKLKSVETLLLNDCRKFIKLHEDIGEMTSLRTLEAERIAIREVPPSIGHLKRLSLVNLTGCWKLSSLPMDFYKLKSVETLLLNDCSKFIELHEDVGEMISLRTLEAKRTSIRKVPPSILGLKNLTRLSLDRIKGKYKYLCWEGCPLKSLDDFLNQDKLVVLEMQGSKLVQVWEGSKSLHNLKSLNLSCTYCLQKSPDFSQVPNLEELILVGCSNLSEIHPSIGHLKRLSLVNLQQCYELISLPGDFYKSKSVETLLLNRCSAFIELHEDIGEMISLRTLEAKDTAIREVPPSIVGLKNLTRLSLGGTMRGIQLPHSLRESDLTYGASDDAIKDLGNLIYLQHLHLQGIMFHSLPNLSGLSKLETLWLNGSRYLRAIPDLPTNLKVLLANDCPALETMPDFSEMSNMRQLDVSYSAKLTEVPGLDKSLNSMAWIDMHGCPNLTVDFRKNILQGWISCGFGGIALHGNYVPDWFEFVYEGTKISFDIPPTDDRTFEGLTLFCLFRQCRRKDLPHLWITVISNTKSTKLQAYKARGGTINENYEDDCLWQGQFSNNELNLQGGDKVYIVFEHPRANGNYSIKMMRIGVNLVWDKHMKDTMHDFKDTNHF